MSAVSSASRRAERISGLLPPPGAPVQGGDGTCFPVAASAAVGAATDAIAHHSVTTKAASVGRREPSSRRLMRKQLVLQKKHSNGRFSEVLRQADGRYTARDGLRRGFAGWHGFTANIANVHDAKAIAAMHSHSEGCDSGCGPWVDVTGDDEEGAK